MFVELRTLQSNYCLLVAVQRTVLLGEHFSHINGPHDLCGR